MSEEERETAHREIAFCEAILAKGGLTVLTEVLRGVTQPESWQKYPEGEVFDPETGAQWFYHCHAEPEADEHGHFHCFLRPDGVDGPIHHLFAVGVDPHGRLKRLFTVNQWVVGDDWLDADKTIALLPRFDVHMPQPNYLVNRWLTAVLTAYEPEIAGLIEARDTAIAALGTDAVAARQDRALEVTAVFRPA